MGTQYGPLHFTCFQFPEKFPYGLWDRRVCGICGHDRGKFFFLYPVGIQKFAVACEVDGSLIIAA
jgi:hypothetical protein